MIQALELLIGLVDGLISGMLGIGGGPVLVPALVFLLGLEQHLAQGVTVAVIAPTAFAGAVTHYRYGNVVLSVVVPVAAAAIVGAVGGAWLAAQLDAGLLRRFFGLLLVTISISAFLRQR